MRYFWIGLGSAVGGMARYWCGETLTRLVAGLFPWGTLFVNVSGCFLIGLFFALTGPEGRIYVPPSLRQFVMFGLMGGYTTFSAFSLETLALARDGMLGLAMLNAAGSFALCLGAVWLGHGSGGWVR